MYKQCIVNIHIYTLCGYAYTVEPQLSDSMGTTCSLKNWKVHNFEFLCKIILKNNVFNFLKMNFNYSNRTLTLIDMHKSGKLKVLEFG